MPLYSSATYTEFTQSAGVITGPTSGSTLTGASTTFTWSPASGSSPSYYLWVGTSPGTYNLAGVGPFSGTSATVNLPTTGATIYVTLQTWISGNSTPLYSSATYTEAP
jgi:hypothetical protein